MGSWSESPLYRIGYLNELKVIDEKILALLAEREKKTNGKRFVPPRELMEQWVDTYNLDINFMKWLFHGFNEASLPYTGPIETGNLVNVVPLMKKVEMDGCQYLLSHMMQYEQASEVIVEINVSELKTKGISRIRPHLILDIQKRQFESSYSVRPMGVSGGGNKVNLKYTVTPKLPDNVEKLQFSLLPNPQPFVEMKELILEQPVQF
jgi:hypothetical protein